MSDTYRPELIEKVMRCTAEAGDCWLFTGALERNGYARVRLGGAGTKRALVHRVMYEQLVAEIPAGLVLDHLCRNRACVNPWHLEPVSNRVNVLRGVSPAAVNASRGACINGHEFTPENTLTGGGRRQCRECNRRRCLVASRRRRGQS